MKKLSVLVVMTFAGLVASAAVPVCVLGGPTAMNPDRQLADGETFVLTDRPLIVNLRFRPTKEHPEQVGECMLPAGKKVAEKGGILQWVVGCGNDEVNKNIPVGPQPAPRDGIDGKNGRDGLAGVDGQPGRDGIDGRDGRDGVSAPMPVPPPPKKWRCGKGCKIAIALIGGGAVAGGVLATRKSGPTPGRPPGGLTGGAFGVPAPGGFRILLR